MNEITMKITKVLKNKNTVTVIGVVIILSVLYWGYSSTIKKAIDPVTVPVASQRIIPETQITQDMIKYIKVAKSVVDTNVLTNQLLILGKYTNIDVTIPEGSMFYQEWLVTYDQLPGSWIESIKYEEDNLEAYYLGVNSVTTFGNSIKPNTRIDLYVKMEDEQEALVFGKLLENIEVLVVKDSAGADVFVDNENIGNPAYFGLAVDTDYYILLKDINYLSSAGVELVVAPHGRELKEDGIQVTSSALRDMIIAKVSTVDLSAEKKEDADPLN